MYGYIVALIMCVGPGGSDALAPSEELSERFQHGKAIGERTF